MLNYTYIFYRYDFVPLNIDEFMTLYNIVMKYHYPCCMHIDNNLTDNEKMEIQTNEPNLVYSKIKEYETMHNIELTYKILQIPRVLYDLYHALWRAEADKIIKCELIYPSLYTYEKYCKYFDKITNGQIDNIFQLNQYICVSILQRIPTNIMDWTNILEQIIGMISVAKHNKQKYLHAQIIANKQILFDALTEYMENNPERRFNIAIISEIYEICVKTNPMINIMVVTNFVRDVLSYVRTKNNKYIKNIDIITYIENYYAGKNYTPDKINYIDEKNWITNFLDAYPHNEKIVIETLKREFNGNNLATILYRATSNEKESVIDPFDEQKGFSISFNTSIFCGMFCDETAYTYELMTRYNKNKYCYVYPRDYHNDMTGWSGIFFVPPIHPFVQLLLYGELWHARSKIFAGSVLTGVREFAGLYDSDVYPFPDYLKSEFAKETLDKYYKDFEKTYRITLIDIDQNADIGIDVKLLHGTSAYNRYIQNKNEYKNLSRLLQADKNNLTPVKADKNNSPSIKKEELVKQILDEELTKITHDVAKKIIDILK